MKEVQKECKKGDWGDKEAGLSTSCLGRHFPPRVGQRQGDEKIIKTKHISTSPLYPLIPLFPHLFNDAFCR